MKINVEVDQYRWSDPAIGIGTDHGGSFGDGKTVVLTRIVEARLVWWAVRLMFVREMTVDAYLASRKKDHP